MRFLDGAKRSKISPSSRGRLATAWANPPGIFLKRLKAGLAEAHTASTHKESTRIMWSSHRYFQNNPLCKTTFHWLLNSTVPYSDRLHNKGCNIVFFAEHSSMRLSPKERMLSYLKELAQWMLTTSASARSTYSLFRRIEGRGFTQAVATFLRKTKASQMYLESAPTKPILWTLAVLIKMLKETPETLSCWGFRFSILWSLQSWRHLVSS